MKEKYTEAQRPRDNIRHTNIDKLGGRGERQEAGQKKMKDDDTQLAKFDFKNDAKEVQNQRDPHLDIE